MKKKKNPNFSRCIKIEGQKKYQKILNNKIESKQWMKQPGTEKNPKNSQDEYGSNLKIKTSEKGNNKQPTSIRTR